MVTQLVARCLPEASRSEQQVNLATADSALNTFSQVCPLNLLHDTPSNALVKEQSSVLLKTSTVHDLRPASPNADIIVELFCCSLDASALGIVIRVVSPRPLSPAFVLLR